MAVGNYRAQWWPTKYVPGLSGRGEAVSDPPKPNYRKYLVAKCTAIRPHEDPYYSARGYTIADKEPISSEELLNAELTVANSDTISRHEQAVELAHAGYGGPLGSGEARGLKNLFAELGMTELIKRGWIKVECEVWRNPTARAIQRAAWRNLPAPIKTKVQTTKLQYCYVFKSPMEGVHFSKFIRLARMYKDDKGGLKAAVRAVLANPEAANEIEALDAMELLAGMKGM